MAKQVFAFAEFTFDAETGTLTRKKRSAHLPEQTALLLEVLLENANQLVSRDELRQVLWPDEEFLDYTQGINVAVNRLRNILRDDPRNPRFLKTIPKRGCSRFLRLILRGRGIPLSSSGFHTGDHSTHRLPAPMGLDSRLGRPGRGNCHPRHHSLETRTPTSRTQPQPRHCAHSCSRRATEFRCWRRLPARA
jgi:hypothetical protein